MLSSKHPHPHLRPRPRPSLVRLFRSESASAIRALTPDKPIQLKLPTLHFFIHAFAILLDSQSCLSLSYEALTMRQRHTHPNPHFQVSSHEWINFAQLAFHFAFYPVTIQACKNALACLNIPETTTTIDEIQRLMDAAIVSSSNHSVQAHTTEYVKKKTMIESSVSNETESPASISFRNGIKLHNARYVALECYYGLARIWTMKELPVDQRADAVSSLVFEGNARIRDPVYGSVGAITSLQNQVSQPQMQLDMAQAQILSLQLQRDLSTVLLQNQIQQLSAEDKSLILAANNSFSNMHEYFDLIGNASQDSLK